MAIKMRMPVRVTGVTLNESSINLTTAGDTEQLTATISPNNAEDTAVTWSSSDTTVATVSNTGLVTCVTPGTATITVTTHDGGYTATCGITNVTNPIPTNGLLAYYPMDIDWNDHKSELGVSGTTYNCTTTGTFSYQFETGHIGNCIHKTTDNEGLDTGIALGSEYTVMMWLKQDSQSGWKVHWSTKSTDAGNGQQSQWEGKVSYYTVGIKSKSSHYWYSTNYTPGNWVHWCVTRNGSTVKMYLNGVGETFTIDNNNGPNTLHIIWYGSQYEDEVCVYNRVLTDQEISDYYTATA